MDSPQEVALVPQDNNIKKTNVLPPSSSTCYITTMQQHETTGSPVQQLAPSPPLLSSCSSQQLIALVCTSPTCIDNPQMNKLIDDLTYVSFASSPPVISPPSLTPRAPSPSLPSLTPSPHSSCRVYTPTPPYLPNAPPTYPTISSFSPFLPRSSQDGSRETSPLVPHPSSPQLFPGAKKPFQLTPPRNQSLPPSVSSSPPAMPHHLNSAPAFSFSAPPSLPPLLPSISSELYQPKPPRGVPPVPSSLDPLPAEWPTSQSDLDCWDREDEYRDDDDPGYRVRDLWESELMQEIAMRLHHPSHCPYPAVPVFTVPPSSTASSLPASPLIGPGAAGWPALLEADDELVATSSSFSALVGEAGVAAVKERFASPTFGVSAEGGEKRGGGEGEKDQLSPPPQSLVGADDDELMDCRMSEVPSSDVVPPPASDEISPLSTAALPPIVDQDVPCSSSPVSRPTLFPSPAPSPAAATSPTSNGEAGSDASRWSSHYCGGDMAAFRERMRRLKLPSVGQAHSYPPSGDPVYPIKVPARSLSSSAAMGPPQDRTSSSPAVPSSPDSPVVASGRRACSKTVVDCFNLKVVFERDKTGFEEYRELALPPGTIVGGRYEVEQQLGQAAFCRALQCLDRVTQCRVCMKVIKNDKDYVDQSLDEIKLLRFINWNGDADLLHFLKLYDFFYCKEHLIIITEVLKDNLYDFYRKQKTLQQQRLPSHTTRKAPPASPLPKPSPADAVRYFSMGHVQRIAYQVLVSLRFIHSLRLIHCDLKPENILICDEERCAVKVIDFGSSCFEDDNLSTYVQSRSYRAPEVLLGLPYDHKVDMWSLGCVLAELWTGYVLFQNESAQSLLARIVGIVGHIPYYMVRKASQTPNLFTQDAQLFQVLHSGANEEKGGRRGRRFRLLLPKKSSLEQRMRTKDHTFVGFLECLLQIDPCKRPTAHQALQHEWFARSLYVDGLQ
eukprot:GHVS01049981.1.p1 GENE.GHVS01049981.1~~GHVS01049981.1.p1  ORF type:complete len:952 (+),score=208.61 GHVS01049981.1:86-2941(+)